jgi:uncharacterized membrane protein HdeD (DUF308 family)
MLQDTFTLRWSALLVRGLIGVGFGVVAMVWPEETMTVLVVLWGCWALLDGVMLVASAFVVEGTAPKLLAAAIGVVALLAAFFALLRPGLAAATLTWFIGIWLVVRAIFEIISAFSATEASSRWVLVLGGVLDGLIGILFIANPGTGALAIAFVVGLLALFWGCAFVVLAFVVRRAEKTAHVVPPGAAYG